MEKLIKIISILLLLPLLSFGQTKFSQLPTATPDTNTSVVGLKKVGSIYTDYLFTLTSLGAYIGGGGNDSSVISPYLVVDSAGSLVKSNTGQEIDTSDLWINILNGYSFYAPQYTVGASTGPVWAQTDLLHTTINLLNTQTGNAFISLGNAQISDYNGNVATDYSQGNTGSGTGVDLLENGTLTYSTFLNSVFYQSGDTAANFNEGYLINGQNEVMEDWSDNIFPSVSFPYGISAPSSINVGASTAFLMPNSLRVKADFGDTSISLIANAGELPRINYAYSGRMQNIFFNAIATNILDTFPTVNGTIATTNHLSLTAGSGTSVVGSAGVWTVSATGGSSGVSSITAGNGSITVGGTSVNPTVAINPAYSNTFTATQVLANIANDSMIISPFNIIRTQNDGFRMTYAYTQEYRNEITGNKTTIEYYPPTYNNQITFPDTSGTVAMLSNITSAINGLSLTAGSGTSITGSMGVWTVSATGIDSATLADTAVVMRGLISSAGTGSVTVTAGYGISAVRSAGVYTVAVQPPITNVRLDGEAYTVNLGVDNYVFVETDYATTYDVNLPTLSGSSPLYTIIIADEAGDAGTNHIVINASNPINGTYTYTISANYGSVTLVNDENIWLITATH